MISEPQKTSWPQFVLRRADQAVVAVVVACSLIASAAHWIAQGGHRGQLLEVERLQPGTIPYVVDLNQADWVEFTVLPGVGETLAKRIVESRKQQGPFREIEDLSRVNGIGPRTVERLRPYLRPLSDFDATADSELATQPPS